MLSIHYTCSKLEAAPFIKNIKFVLNLLPLKTKQTIHDKCMIFLMGKTYGYSIGMPYKHLILLNIHEMKTDCLSVNDQRFIIAHEFAHFILNHMESSDQEEHEANMLVHQWGFSPIDPN